MNQYNTYKIYEVRPTIIIFVKLNYSFIPIDKYVHLS